MENAVKMDYATESPDNGPMAANAETRKAWLAEGRQAWEDYQRTGLHLANEEVLDWMEKVIQGEDARMPKCHMQSAGQAMLVATLSGCFFGRKGCVRSKTGGSRHSREGCFWHTPSVRICAQPRP